MVARAPILGITGLIFLVFGLLSHWLTYSPAEGFFSFGWYSLLHVVAGVVCLIAYFVRGSGSVFEFVRARSTRYGANAIVYTLLFVGVIAMLNFLAVRYHRRFDMSVEGVSSLSQQSLEVLDRLKEDVQLDVFLQAGRDPVLEELFDAYKYHTDKVKPRFLDPQVRPELAQQAGITQVPSIRVYMGDRSTIVTETDEESVTNAIHRISNPERKKIYFVTGHGEPATDDQQTVNGFGLFADSLTKQNYLVESLFLPEVEKVPDDAAALVIVSTEKDYFPREIEILTTYLRGGGHALFLLEPRQGASLVTLLAQFGIQADNDVIVDQQLRLFEGVSLALEPVVSTYSEHPSVAQIKERTLYSLARSVRPMETLPQGLIATGIAFTAKTSWGETDIDQLFNQSQAQLGDTDVKGPVAIGSVASAFAKDIGGQGEGELKIAAFGDSSFATNKYWRQLFNDALVLSVTGWLAGEEARVSIGPRIVRASRAHLSQTQGLSVFYLSVLVLPELILLAGIAVWWRRSAL